jgi:23S rRNA (cytosine1962-C5)-methyltransferase
MGIKFTEQWSDFEIIASGGGEKLERWGEIFLLRPDPQAIWASSFDLSGYKGLHAVYKRSSGGGGAWDFRCKFPREQVIRYKSPAFENSLKFLVSPTNFKHMGLFPEQAVNWDKISDLITGEKYRKISTLNLFGYTGGATIAAAASGAFVTHVDASKGMVEVCKRNCKLNEVPTDRVRFIVDDCVKFVEREIRRNKRYDAIIMDPPSFGRGAGGEVWKLEEGLDRLAALCCKLLSDKPSFFLINSYTAGLQPTVIKNILQRNLAKLQIGAMLEAYEIGLPTSEGIVLPAGCSCLACNFRR